MHKILSLVVVLSVLSGCIGPNNGPLDYSHITCEGDEELDSPHIAWLQWYAGSDHSNWSDIPDNEKETLDRYVEKHNQSVEWYRYRIANDMFTRYSSLSDHEKAIFERSVAMERNSNQSLDVNDSDVRAFFETNQSPVSVVKNNYIIRDGTLYRCSVEGAEPSAMTSVSWEKG